MDHKKYKELLLLSIINEINENDKQMLEVHLASCQECKKELAASAKLMNIVKQHKYIKEGDADLISARRELRIALDNEKMRENKFSGAWNNIINFLSVNYRFAITGAAALFIGLTAGYFIFSGNNSLPDMDAPYLILTSNSEMFSKFNLKISNLRFLDADASDGEIAFIFDAVKPVKMTGKITDDLIQKILAYSLVNEQNDGVRLRTVSTIAGQTERELLPDRQIKISLLTAMKYDQNPGVRREALLTLKKLQLDKEILDAFLYVLANDKNAGLRIAAINSIDPAELSSYSLDKNMLNILNNKIQTDENEYIRVRAKTVLEEVTRNENI